MRIAFVYDGAYPWIKGGVEKRVYEIGRRLAERGHDVHWYCVGWWLPDNGERTIEIDGIKYHAVCEPLEIYVNGRRSIKAAIKFSISLTRPLLREKFDIIDCQQFPYFSCFSAKLASLVNKSSLIITVLEYWGDYWYEYLGKVGIFGKIVERLTFNLTSDYITISSHVRNYLSFCKDSIHIVPDGVPFNKIRKIKPSSEKANLIFVGRLIKHKNVDVLLKALHLLRDDGFKLTCIIIGDGPEKENLMKITRDLGLEAQVKFMGRVPSDDEVYKYMKSCNIFVFPSSREGAGLVTLEANAAGLPVITTNHKLNASRELINGKNGVLFNLDPHDLKEKIILIMNEHEKLRKDCIKFAESYSWDKIADLTENVYLEVLK
ncbi:glycosyltransferase family 4 protein [Methanothermobacter thermautotrophicus]|nr:glycosyltransferase family 4 protein [Methanothermobacter thermautotrophicus]MDI6818561.1 glycosyltransferase family 4 protein [Methanothermobacter thermautotrophicus]WBF06628.1 glycosyltransferase family 4 protein [Methanothermobacter thermautotrophicus]